VILLVIKALIRSHVLVFSPQSATSGPGRGGKASGRGGVMRRARSCVNITVAHLGVCVSLFPIGLAAITFQHAQTLSPYGGFFDQNGYGELLQERCVPEFAALVTLRLRLWSSTLGDRVGDDGGLISWCGGGRFAGRTLSGYDLRAACHAQKVITGASLFCSLSGSDWTGDADDCAGTTTFSMCMFCVVSSRLVDVRRSLEESCA